MKKYIIVLLCFVSLSAQAANYAVVDGNGNVTNVISYDGVSLYNPPAGSSLVKSDTAGIGWTYSNEQFSPPVPPTPTVTQQVTSALAAGLSVSSTDYSGLNGTYALDQSSQNQVNAVTTYILLNGTFPGGGSTMPWVDQTGAAHQWPSVTEFKSFATAYANYVAAISLYQLSNGASGSLPSNTVTIP